MTDKRWNKLMLNTDMKLTKKEIAEGYHWCADFDFLLVGPDMMEWDVCQCEDGPRPPSRKRTLDEKPV